MQCPKCGLSALRCYGWRVCTKYFGRLPVLESVRSFTDMVLDIHLMIKSPANYVSKFSNAGADIITFHVEAEPYDSILSAIDEIHKLGKKAGLSLKPDTPLDTLLPFVHKLDLVLIMTVEPGFGGQMFIPEMLKKISVLRDLIESRKLDCEIQVDGGINQETAKLCVNAGANVLVAGEYIFKASDRGEKIAKLRELK